MRHRLQSVVRSLLILLLAASAGAAQLQPTGTAVPGEVLVKIQAGTSQGAISSIMAEADDGERLAGVSSGTLWRVRSRSKSADALAMALQKNPHVVFAEPNYIVRLVASPNDPYYGSLWGLRNTGQSSYSSGGFPGSDIDAEAAWTLTTGSSSVVVGVVDTGVDYLHPDLAANMWSNPGGKGNAACAAGTFGFNAITKTCDPQDDHGHGTHVAGTIGAVGNNNLGVTGVNWTASIMALKFLNAHGSGTTADAIAAIEFAIQAKIDGVNVRVLSNSWGGGGFSKALLDVIHKANEHDILFVAAAGNDSSNNDTFPRYPTNYATPNMISVAATHNRDGLTWFSNFGAKTVHLAAPGADILSTVPGGYYSTFSGTSMAAPHVSGAAALLLSKSPGLTTAQVKTAILDGVDLVPGLAGKTITGGRLNAAKVVGAPPSPEFALSVTPATRSVTRGGNVSYTVTVAPANGFSSAVTLSLGTLPTGVAGSFSPNPATTTSTLTVSASASTALNSYSLPITATGGGVTRAAFAGLNVTAETVPACPLFARSADYGIASPTSLVTADFDRDGHPDLAVSLVDSNGISVRLGNGTGALPFSSFHTTGTGPIAIATGDFNSDGKADLVTANSTSNDVSILLGNGAGNFAAAVAYEAGTTPFHVAVGDFNNDAHSDLVVANNSSDDVSILLGAGDGTFGAPADYATASGPYAVAVGDFNRDGDADLAVAGYDGGKVSILFGAGDGTFAAAVDYAVLGGPSFVAVGDFNGDGRSDLAVTSYTADKVSILIGNDDGTFQPAVHHAAGDGPHAVAIADFNSDGWSDLIVANGNATNVSMLLGTGTGTFQAAIFWSASGNYPQHVVAGDFNGDAKPDFVLAHTSSSAISVLLNFSQCDAQCGTLASALNSGVSGNPYSVVSGDFNRDGRTDVAASARGTNNVSVLMGNGDGTYAAAAVSGAGTNPDSITTADFNRDGMLDLATANSGSGNVSVLLGNGSGTFQSAVNHTAGSTPRSIATADFNRDGDVDLAVATAASNSVAILLGNGDGTFQSPLSVPAGTTPFAATPGDFNGDGKSDLAVANSGSNNVSILLGNGDGTFQTPTNYGAGTGPRAIAVHDYDRDGKQDLAVVNAGSHDVSLLYGLGTGAFEAAEHYTVGQGPFDVAAGDINADGVPDLAVTNNAGGSVSVLLGTGGGTFGSATAYAGGFTGPAGIVVTDADRDGKPDVLVASSGTLTVTLLRNTCPSPDLTITKTHTDSFAQGSASKSYFITVRNSGLAPTTTPVTVTDTLPTGLSASAISGAGWTCTLATLTCTRADALGGGAQYPAVQLTVNVLSSAPANVTNRAAVSGGGDLNTLNNTASDPTVIAPRTDLTVTSTHSGSFVQGATGQTYTLVVRNAGGLASSGFVTVTDTLPTGLTATGMSGSGWSCSLPSLTCNRSDVLAAGAAYPPIKLTVKVAATAPPSVVNTVSVTGGGQVAGFNDTFDDPTVIWSAQSCGSFGKPAFYNAGSQPSGLAKGYFNADGSIDLAVINYYSNSVSVFLGKPDGTFHGAVNYAADLYPRAIAPGDFDNDGHVDLVIAAEAHIVILRGAGNGTFAAPLRYALAVEPRKLVLGDFNNDGNDDVAVTADYANKVLTFIGNGDATLRDPVVYTLSGLSTGLAAGDFDGNGTADLALSLSTSALAILSGNGDGTFTAATDVPLSYGSSDVVAADFSQDAKVDLAVLLYSDVAILSGKGDGTFQTAVLYDVPYGMSNVVAEDFTGDGKTDLAVGGSWSGGISILPGFGDGTFLPAFSVSTAEATEVTVGDFNGDGKPDLAQIGYGGLRILLGGCADLTITKSHNGNFRAGQQEALYTITVKNIGTGASRGAVTVSDVLPDGLTISYMYGSGWWSCNSTTATCTSTVSLPATESAPPISVYVDVASDAPASVINTARVTGGSDNNTANNEASDPTTIAPVSDLAVSVAPTGMFAQGQTGRTYTITVSNVGSIAWAGNVSVYSYLPSTVTPTEISGAGWECQMVLTRACSRSDGLAGNSSYPPIVVTVNVGITAPASISNYVELYASGDTNYANNATSRTTSVLGIPHNLIATGAPSEVTLSWDHAAHAAYYELYRSHNGGSFALLGSMSSRAFVDQNVSPNASYVYRVRAVATSTFSAFSSGDVATTLLFTDELIVPGVTPLKAVHLTELRTAVNALRKAAGLLPLAFENTPVSAGSVVSAAHWSQLRGGLDEARNAFGLIAVPYTDPTIAAGTTVKAAHLRDLRSGVR